MNHNKISDTLYNVTGLYDSVKYPNRMLQWMLKGEFFRKSLCWYLENRFTAITRNMPETKRMQTMVSKGTQWIIRDIAIKHQDDPTKLIRAMLSSFYSHVERYLNNPITDYMNDEPLVRYSPIDIPSDHHYTFKLLKPRRNKRSKTDPYGITVMGKKRYYISLRLEK